MCEVSIIVPSVGNINNLNNLLSSIENQYFKNLEVILVINGLSHKIQGLKPRPFPVHVTYLDKANTNIARNMGAISAKGRFFYFIDDDCELDKNAVNAIYEHYISNKFSFLGGGYKSFTNDRLISKIYNHICNRWIQFHCKNSKITPLLGGNIFTNRIFYFYSGGFSIDHLNTAEEIDLILSAHKRGMTVTYNPKFNIYHNYQKSLFTMLKNIIKSQFALKISNSRSFWKKLIFLFSKRHKS